MADDDSTKPDSTALARPMIATDLDKLMEEYDRLSVRFEAARGYDVEHRTAVWQVERVAGMEHEAGIHVEPTNLLGASGLGQETLVVNASTDQDTAITHLSVLNAGTAPASVEVSSPSGAPPPPNASAQPTPSNTAAGAAAVLPAALRGRWGLTPGDCAGAGSNGLLVVEDRALRFYESQAVPTGNVEAGADSFSADFAFTGEGMTWTKFQSLQIQNGNLIRTESSPMASFTYAKCS